MQSASNDLTDSDPAPTRYRAIFLSDIHLGTRGCKADFLLNFLRRSEAEFIYLLGDVVDGWRLKKSWYWPQAHNDIVQKLLRKTRKGCQTVYIPGNHDEGLRDFLDMRFGGVTLAPEGVHVTADGKRLLILHGDVFDGLIRYGKFLSLLGDWGCDAAVFLNHHFNGLRRRFNYPYWSLAAHIKGKFKNAADYIARFARAAAHEALRRGFDGIVCGHIHCADIREIDGVLYCNDGDWVESCTALVEHLDGRLEIITCTEAQAPPVEQSTRRRELRGLPEAVARLLTPVA